MFENTIFYQGLRVQNAFINHRLFSFSQSSTLVLLFYFVFGGGLPSSVQRALGPFPMKICSVMLVRRFKSSTWWCTEAKRDIFNDPRFVKSRMIPESEKVGTSCMPDMHSNLSIIFLAHNFGLFFFICLVLFGDYTHQG